VMPRTRRTRPSTRRALSSGATAWTRRRRGRVPGAADSRRFSACLHQAHGDRHRHCQHLGSRSVHHDGGPAHPRRSVSGSISARPRRESRPLGRRRPRPRLPPAPRQDARLPRRHGRGGRRLPGGEASGAAASRPGGARAEDA
jgi:hypothetical protein